jgi:adenylate kinase
MLTECLGVPHISTGDMLRDRIRLGSEMGTAVVATMQAGALVSDDLVNRIVVERITRPEAAEGFVLDGYPRTLAQAEHLCRWLDEHGLREVVIHLAVDYNVIIARLTGRRVCPRCGTLYNTASQPSKEAGLCDLDGEELIVRDDDSEPVIRERLEAYYRQTHPVLQFYQSSGRRVVEVDASYDPPPAIFQKIRQALER